MALEITFPLVSMSGDAKLKCALVFVVHIGQDLISFAAERTQIRIATPSGQQLLYLLPIPHHQRHPSAIFA